ncbi:MAG: polyprenyl synthetase family protein [Thermoguttaceae bacterium]|nr:polyprenyl synthetase family protein [Thermoguttaceae bacterium]
MTPPSARAFDLAAAYRPIEDEMEKTTALMKERLRHVEPTFDGYLEYSFRLGGKRLRPALTLLCGKAAGSIDRRHYLVAAALEAIHTGSLVHDDILDGAAFRRHLQTVNARWDSQRAVLIGDLLITRAFNWICECDDGAIFRKIADACEATVEGELLQTESIGNFALETADYEKIVGGKTASLLECACYLGAYLGGARGDDLAAYGRFGAALGIAFQIADDVLDLVGDEAKTGKTLGTDLANKKETLPLILYFQKATPEERAALTARLGEGVSPEAGAEISAALVASGAVAEALDRANALVDEALAIVADLKAKAAASGRDLAAFDSLAALARFVARRDL